ncbi:nuclear pore complex protein GP210-like [Vicia villosa]|uniref:nuclear pore complex protein GP210-like n=1 Tax=Vicia villosa TaxID=3911 RepID=UPI00273ADE46|nr:nuclear pore complex protein GP210-like [Vicia villosa]
MTFPVEYRLQGSDGCFKCHKCSTSARLRSIAPYSGRKETAVYATDVKTGIVIRCKVFIDNISRIQIFHHSIKLDLDGLATLHIRAFDKEVFPQRHCQLSLHDGGLVHGDLTLPEDKAVDLYVLERALVSMHSSCGNIIDRILAAYRKSSKQWSSTMNKLADVRQRGRKRTMVG